MPSEALRPVESMTIGQLQTAITRGEYTRRDIVAAHLARISAFNSAVNGFVEMRGDEALREAEIADREHGRALCGPLDGVALSVKDSYSVKGLRRTNGLPVNAENYETEDHLVVSRLRDAGAFVLGHAAIPDLCIRWNTISGLYGTTRNPRDLTRAAGGSSGGDAANVAAGFATIGLGGDLGGSIRVPASFCGVYGFRPGAGRVPDVNPNGFQGALPSSELMYEIGPLARSVVDIETTFRVIHGRDPRDPATADAPLVTSETLPRVAVLRHETGARLAPEIERRLDETADMLRDEGYEVVEKVLPDLRRAADLWVGILGTEIIQGSLPAVRDDVLPSAVAHLEEMFGAHEYGPGLVPYLEAWRERRLLQEQLIGVMVEYPLILAPVAGMTAPLLDFDDHIGVEATRDLFDQMRCVGWVNLFSLPSLALPNGIQIVGRRFEELDVLKAGYAAERHLPAMTIADLA